ncbi:MAG TPA: VacJ family lipoprotein [Steroidobacteraceae bacterium]|nr:VacJ family lipoprotein [Steroidobacteraceae bacterium]
MLKSVLALAMLLLAGCASLPSGKADPRDPWERFNRSTFAFNDAMDRAIARPVAKAYKKVMPRFVRAGVNNVFNNLNTVNTAVNDALQGKMRAAGHDSTRFLMNTVFGFGGLFDPATRAGIEMNDEDFGQTFGKWGMKSGPYLVLPILGPSSARDTFGKLVDQFTYPVSYLEDDSTRFYIRLVSLLDTRTELLDLDAQIDASYDKYAFVRNAWLQRREFQVKDGNVDDASLDLEEGMEPEDEAPADGQPADGQPTDGTGESAMPPESPAPTPPQ